MMLLLQAAIYEQSAGKVLKNL